MADDDGARFLVHQATHLFLTEPIHFQLVQMNKSMFVWVGKNARLNDLSVAMPSFGTQATTTVLGKDVAELSRNMARRLALKYNQQFYVSLDLGKQDDLLNAFVEKKLMLMIKAATA
ncbi:hypothetical protein DFQ28_002214 [Apophysomyces sp. BC1034]|nr:hypothetical protein DFQ30_002746 [Apophysomyces sp. BC1015]KAG0179844.1 hypothetical protein DFQ29_001608 [Apophysomyces sp. BC1021]KAG0190329.1 hypothetical protein DFQ28_002214 [Apophysomyces sp. BC1034]